MGVYAYACAYALVMKTSLKSIKAIKSYDRYTSFMKYIGQLSGEKEFIPKHD